MTFDQSRAKQTTIRSTSSRPPSQPASHPTSQPITQRQQLTQHWANLWRRRWFRWSLLGSAALIALGALAALTLSIIIVRYGTIDRAQAADVIVVLGGGPSSTERRTAHAITLYEQGYADRIICSGGSDGVPLTAGKRCFDELVRGGVPPAAIIQETHSLSTEENALEVSAIMRANDWRDAVLVTDNFHLWRAMILFRERDVTVYTSPVQATQPALGMRDYGLSLVRELAATTWHYGKEVLGLPHTRFDDPDVS